MVDSEFKPNVSHLRHCTQGAHCGVSQQSLGDDYESKVRQDGQGHRSVEGFLEEEAFARHLKGGVRFDQKGRESKNVQAEGQCEQGRAHSSNVEWRRNGRN